MSARASLAAALAFALLLATAPLAGAGTGCSEQSLTVERFRQADALARQVHALLDRDTPQVALLARAGADLSRHGLRFSHAAFLRRAPGGRHWHVLHLLNHCGRASSALYREGLINFFLDDPFEYAALVVVPDAGLQRRLVEELDADAPRALFEPHYDMLAHPRSLRAQNSNQWLLEVLAAAQAPRGRVRGRADAQGWLGANGFVADTVHVPAVERLGARLFRANVGFDGQPAQQRMQGRIEVVTVDSVLRYLERGAAVASARVLELAPAPPPPSPRSAAAPDPGRTRDR